MWLVPKRFVQQRHTQATIQDHAFVYMRTSSVPFPGRQEPSYLRIGLHVLPSMRTLFLSGCGSARFSLSLRDVAVVGNRRYRWVTSLMMRGQGATLAVTERRSIDEHRGQPLDKLRAAARMSVAATTVVSGESKQLVRQAGAAARGDSDSPTPRLQWKPGKGTRTLLNRS
jgi:hypothetical protein